MHAFRCSVEDSPYGHCPHLSSTHTSPCLDSIHLDSPHVVSWRWNLARFISVPIHPGWRLVCAIVRCRICSPVRAVRAVRACRQARRLAKLGASLDSAGAFRTSSRAVADGVDVESRSHLWGRGRVRGFSSSMFHVKHASLSAVEFDLPGGIFFDLYSQIATWEGHRRNVRFAFRSPPPRFVNDDFTVARCPFLTAPARVSCGRRHRCPTEGGHKMQLP